MCSILSSEDEDWTDPKVWKKANPSLGITVGIDKVKAACESAKQNPGEENSFRQLRLNQWVKQAVRWMPMDKWDACAFAVDPESLEGRVCYGGLDLSSTTDITAFVRKSWQSTFGGSGNANKIAVLEEGMKYTPIGISPEQAQFLETRKFQINEIARISRVPPHMVGDLEKSSFSNIEQQSLEFVKYTLDHWVIRWEQTLSRTLFSEEGKKEYFFKFNFAEPRSDGGSNAKIANILEYGKHGQRSKPFLKPAKSASKSATQEAMIRTFDEEVGKL